MRSPRKKPRKTAHTNNRINPFKKRGNAPFFVCYFCLRLARLAAKYAITPSTASPPNTQPHGKDCLCLREVRGVVAFSSLLENDTFVEEDAVLVRRVFCVPVDACSSPVARSAPMTIRLNTRPVSSATAIHSKVCAA